MFPVTPKTEVTVAASTGHLIGHQSTTAEETGEGLGAVIITDPEETKTSIDPQAPDTEALAAVLISIKLKRLVLLGEKVVVPSKIFHFWQIFDTANSELVATRSILSDFISDSN